MAGRHLKQRGITSIVVVLFAALLFSILTISFVSLMARDQRRASDDELSQSAYDSALAGVEDAKRVIMAARGGSNDALEAINAGECDTIQRAQFAPAGPEVFIKSSNDVNSGEQLNQAYTCVKVTFDSPNFLVDLEKMRSELVPLTAKSSFDTIRIEWHQPSTADGLTGPCSEGLPLGLSEANVLCPEGEWAGADADATTPSLLRAQIITPGSTINNFDTLNTNAAGQTVFLYPSSAGAGNVDLSQFDRYYDNYGDSGSVNVAKLVECSIDADVPVGGYSCRIDLELSPGVSADSALSMMRLTSIYSGTKVKVTLLNGSTRVDFSGVQPTVDSTGRANDLFRRVEARLNLASDLQLPEAAIDMAGPLCKDFFVTDTQAGWFGDAHCSPLGP